MSILKGVSWGYLEKWGNKFISLLVFILLARILDPKDFGLVAFAKLFIDYLDWFSGQGMDSALIQRKEVTAQHLNTAFWINMMLATMLAIALYLLAPWVERHFEESGVCAVIRVLSIVGIISALSRVQVAILLRKQQFRSLAIRGVLMSISGGVAGIIFALLGYGVWSLVCQQLVSMLVALLLLWNASSWRPNLSFSFNAAKELYIFGAKVFFDQQVVFAAKRIDEALIAAFLNISLLGYYSVAKRIFETAVELIYPILNRVLVTVFSRVQDDLSAILERTVRVNSLIAAFTYPLIVLAVIANQEIILLLFGRKWEFASVPFAILMASAVFLLIPNLFHPIFNATGKPGITLKLNSLRAIVSVVLISLGALFGLHGIAIAVLVRNLVGAFLDFTYMKIELKYDGVAILRDQLKYLLYCVPMTLVVTAIGSAWGDLLIVPVRFMLYGVVGLSVYYLTLKFFKASVINDAKVILLKNVVNRWG